MNLNVSQLCKTLEANRSGYYALLNRPKSDRKQKNVELIEEIKKIHHKTKRRYGAPRITRALKAVGQECSENRIAKLMKKEGIFGCQRKKFRPKTTTSNHSLPIAPRTFKIEEPSSFPTAPNQVWVSDITYVGTGEGWLYLTSVLDVFNRKVVGYAMADHLHTTPVWEAMRHAIVNEKGALSSNSPSLLIHSDRGCQYASEAFREKLKLLGVAQSMSRKGNCYDNAYAESFFHTLKVELVYEQDFATRAEAVREIRDYIHWYNCERLHSGIGYQTPMGYEPKTLTA